MTGAAEGPGPRHGDLGLGQARGRGGPGGQGGSRGSLSPAPLAVKVRSLAAAAGGGTQWEMALPALFLKGLELLKGHAGLGRGHGSSQPLRPGVELSAFSQAVGPRLLREALGFLLLHRKGIVLGLFPLEGPWGWGPHPPCPLGQVLASPRGTPQWLLRNRGLW